MDPKIRMSKADKGNKVIGKYTLISPIGKGQFGDVYKAVHSDNSNEYAVKVIAKYKFDDNPMLEAYFNTEVFIMSTINHKNIIRLHDLLETPNRHYLVMDYCSNGDFKNYLNKRGVTKLPETEAISVLKQIRDGFVELRKKKILHRDFKLENLLMNGDELKIADFGVSKEGTDIGETYVGTPLTQAPEVMEVEDFDRQYNSKADLWSVGVVFYRILFGEYPFQGKTRVKILEDIKKKSNGNISYPFDVSNEVQNLLNRIFVLSPKKRLKWSEFFSHDIFVKENKPDPIKDRVSRTIRESLKQETVLSSDIDEVSFLETDDMKGVIKKASQVVEESAVSDNTIIDIYSRYDAIKSKIAETVFLISKIDSESFNPQIRSYVQRTIFLLFVKSITNCENLRYVMKRRINVMKVDDKEFEKFDKSSYCDKLLFALRDLKLEIYNKFIRKLGELYMYLSTFGRYELDYTRYPLQVGQKLNELHETLKINMDNIKDKEQRKTMFRLMDLISIYENNKIVPVGKGDFTFISLDSVVSSQSEFLEDRSNSSSNQFYFELFDLYMESLCRLLVLLAIIQRLSLFDSLFKTDRMRMKGYEAYIYLFTNFKIIKDKLVFDLNQKANVFNGDPLELDSIYNSYKINYLKSLFNKMNVSLHMYEMCLNIVKAKRPFITLFVNTVGTKDMNEINSRIFFLYEDICDSVQQEDMHPTAKADFIQLLSYFEFVIEFRTYFFTPRIDEFKYYQKSIRQFKSKRIDRILSFK